MCGIVSLEGRLLKVGEILKINCKQPLKSQDKEAQLTRHKRDKIESLKKKIIIPKEEKYSFAKQKSNSNMVELNHIISIIPINRNSLDILVGYKARQKYGLPTGNPL